MPPGLSGGYRHAAPTTVATLRPGRTRFLRGQVLPCEEGKRLVAELKVYDGFGDFDLGSLVQGQINRSNSFSDDTPYGVSQTLVLGNSHRN